MHDLNAQPIHCPECRVFSGPIAGLATRMAEHRDAVLARSDQRLLEERDPAVRDAIDARLVAIGQPTSDLAWLAWDAAHRRLDDVQRAAYDRLVVRDLEAARRRG